MQPTSQHTPFQTDDLRPAPLHDLPPECPCQAGRPVDTARLGWVRQLRRWADQLRDHRFGMPPKS